MESASNLLIAIDAGHGGWDNGAQAFGRREKDDNLRLALEVRDQLTRQGFRVRITRDDDTFIDLADRARIANENDADLLISLHRNFYSRQTDETYGVENFIYLTAPPETSGRAAQLVLAALEDAGVQRIVGVSRGNFAVLRRAVMPAMLLEMGNINNETDNRLFDENLVGYGKAIAKGIMDYFGIQWNENATNAPPPSLVEGNEIYDMQELLEKRYGFGLRASGRYDATTRRAATVALQIELNGAYEAGLSVDGTLGSKTVAAIRPIRQGNKGGLVALLQVLLILNGYEPGEVDGEFGRRTGVALRFFQRDNYLNADGVAGRESILALLHT